MPKVPKDPSMGTRPNKTLNTSPSSHKKNFLFGIVRIPSIPKFSFLNRNANVCFGIPIDFVVFKLNRNFGIAGRALYLLLHKSVKLNISFGFSENGRQFHKT